jgi:hypothetical protein
MKIENIKTKTKLWLQRQETKLLIVLVMIGIEFERMNVSLKISWQDDSFRACEMLFQEQAEQRVRQINCITWNLGFEI